MSTANIKEIFGPGKLSGLSRNGSQVTTLTLNRMYRGDGVFVKTLEQSLFLIVKGWFSLATKSGSES